ncbi:MAG: hypothetical protein V4812_11825 [Pseudomonadota bacterium]
MNHTVRKILCSAVCLLMSAMSLAVYGLGALYLASLTSANSVDDHGLLVSLGCGLVAIAAAIQLFLYKRCAVIGLFIHQKIIWLFFVLPFSLIVLVAVWAVMNINTGTDESGYRSHSSSHFSFD